MRSKLYLSAADSWEERRAAIAETWHEAVGDVCFVPMSSADLRQELESLLQEVSDILLAESFDSQAAQDVGQALVSLLCAQEEILGRSQIVLGRELLAGLSSEEVLRLQPRMTCFLGEMATGFGRRSRQEVLAQQEEIRHALLEARDEAFETLRSQRNFYNTILDMVDALVVALDPEGRVVAYNRACEQVSGYTRDEMRGKRHDAFNVGENPEATETMRKRLMALSPDEPEFIPYESVWLTRDGQRRQIKWSATAVFDSGGEVSHLIGTGLDVTEQRKMEAELEATRRQVAQAEEAERLRLAQDLHDDAVQQLLGLSYQLAEMQERATEEGEWSAGQRLEELIPGLEVMRNEVVAVAQGLRRLISSLRPPGLREMGLCEALEASAGFWQESQGHSAPVINLELPPRSVSHISESVSTGLYRVAQEAVRNALKHADAQTITISLARRDHEIVLRVVDDGRGFRKPPHYFQFGAAGRFGFVGMKERVETIGGELDVASEPGEGTTITARVPVEQGGGIHDERTNTGAAGRRSPLDS